MFFARKSNISIFAADILDRLSLQIAPEVLKLLSLSTLEGGIEDKQKFQFIYFHYPNRLFMPCPTPIIGNSYYPVESDFRIKSRLCPIRINVSWFRLNSLFSILFCRALFDHFSSLSHTTTLHEIFPVFHLGLCDGVADPTLTQIDLETQFSVELKQNLFNF